MSSSAKRLPLPISPTSPEDDVVRDTLDRAQSHDLVFALVGHAGAGASTIGSKLQEELQSHKYKVHFVKMSQLIADCCLLLDRKRWANVASLERLVRTQQLQDAGNWLRKTKGEAFTAGLAIREIRRLREESESESSKLLFIIDNLKNPTEVDALRKVYGRSFYLISVVCGPDKRAARLSLKYKVKKEELKKLMERDEAESDPAGQQVRKTIKSGDFFVNSESPLEGAGDPTEESLKRFIQVVLGTETVTPTRDERGLYAAWTASLRSSCLSRQVGASILNKDGQLLAVGMNDVPKFGGGLYDEGDAGDRRCFVPLDPKKSGERGYCRNDAEKRKIIEQIHSTLRDRGMLRDGAGENDLAAALLSTRVGDLIEFSRAVHAEMDAIVSIARVGGASTLGAILYTTTYPCHNCARHIVAAGIRDVVYVEPYVKSLAVNLHNDTILETTRPAQDGSNQVHFRLFAGVAPRRYAALFERRGEAKDKKGHAVSLTDALHRDPIFTKSHVEFEKVIADEVNKTVGGDGL